MSERHVEFDAGPCFYRRESVQARDLAVLAAAAYRRQHGRLRVLDVMAGSGVRTVRYMQQAGADFVWSNDIDTRNKGALLNNARFALGECTEQLSRVPGWRGDVVELTQVAVDAAGGGGKSAKVSHCEARRLLSAVWLAEDYHDLVDCDTFGSESACIGAALDAATFGGLVYITSTDGFSSGGKRPWRALASYGAYTRTHPFHGEQGLRMLLGSAIREGAVRGLVVKPVFSLYSPHGPVFRAMVRVTRSRLWPQQHYGFVGHCFLDGETQVVPFDRVGSAWCKTRVPGKAAPTPLSTAGPLYTGPLHSADDVRAMMHEADVLGWSGHGFDLKTSDVKTVGHNRPRPLEDTLLTILGESHPELPPWYVLLRDICKHGSLRGLPPRDALIEALIARGFQACRTHIESRAIKTNASMKEICRVCVDDLSLPVVGVDLTIKAQQQAIRSVWEGAVASDVLCI